MNNSTFYCNGYEDASNGLKSSPPAGTTDVIKSEYAAGYAQYLQDEREATGGALLEPDNMYRALTG